jgi:hypothetical protein
MRKHLLALTLSLFALPAWAQFAISGRVTDLKGTPISGASVYLDNTIDGATTDEKGEFKFTTEEKGSQSLVVAEVAHETVGTPLNITGDISGLDLKMKTMSRKLDELVVTAGSFEASDRDKTVLKPLDIVTTAGAQADVVRAIQTLPGTQQQGTNTGLFVRGGDASEAAVIVDGLTAQNAFLSSPPGVAARSRFGPFQFKGVAFSSGGYSARYGQALSSVLELNSNDLPDKSTINTGINMAGVYFSGSKLLKHSAFEGSANYTNLTPFYGIAKTNVDYYKVPQGAGASAKYAWKPNKDGLFKALVNYTGFTTGTRLQDPSDASHTLDFGITNQTTYTTVSYRQILKEKWNLFFAGGYSYNQDDIKWDTTPSMNKDYRMQTRAEAKYYATSRLSLLLGTEVQNFGYDRTWSAWNTNFNETQVAGYAEAEWNPVNWIALKPGIRFENSALLQKSALSPRLAMAIKAGLYGQFSVACGVFYQTVDQQYLLGGYKPDYQQSIHYIANYQYMHNDRTLRLEGYYKDYNQLVREHVPVYDANSFRFPYGKVDNSGYGYATGAELFWRDKKTVKNADYWISYSYIDTRRLFKNYVTEAQPDFIATHNLNLIAKYYIPKISTQVNATYNYSSGRPYYDPANPEFLGGRTPEFHNLSMTVNYLRSIGKWFTVVYAGVDNITNYKSVFGYRFANGQRYEMRPAIYRSVFVGVNFSLTQFDKDEL